jgi:hypothetical protein
MGVKGGRRVRLRTPPPSGSRFLEMWETSRPVAGMALAFYMNQDFHSHMSGMFRMWRAQLMEHMPSADSARHCKFSCRVQDPPRFLQFLPRSRRMLLLVVTEVI